MVIQDANVHASCGALPEDNSPMRLDSASTAENLPKSITLFHAQPFV
jgi:hypothetical protein